MNYKPTIGLEIHAELKTRTKMFCDSLNDPSEQHPNTNVCPVCLGHPGTLPTANKQAIEHVIKVGLALGGKINPVSKFDRKNYFYPDLPKGYQISQYDEPIVLGGSLNGIRIRRIHLEEDTGRLLHDQGGATLVDFNRAGMPLMELVTEPDIKSVDDAMSFSKELQLIFRYLGVSEANMEKGELRIEANVSLNKGTKVELKNINSFAAVRSAIDYELKRQAEVLESGGKVEQETRGWDDTKQKTVSQRSKEEAHDYRYFPEPDLPPFETKAFDLEKLKIDLPELPVEKRKRFADEYKEYKLDAKQVEVLISDPLRAEYFEEMDSELLLVWGSETRYRNEIVKQGVLRNARSRAYSYLVNDLQGLINRDEVSLGMAYDKIPPKNLAEFAFVAELGKQGPFGEEESTDIGRAATKEILEEMFNTSVSSREILSRKNEDGGGIYTISDEGELGRIVDEVIAANPKAVADYKKGKAASLQFLVGQAMAKLKGRGNPEVLAKIFKKNL